MYVCMHACLIVFIKIRFSLLIYRMIIVLHWSVNSCFRKRINFISTFVSTSHFFWMIVFQKNKVSWCKNILFGEIILVFHTLVHFWTLYWTAFVVSIWLLSRQTPVLHGEVFKSILLHVIVWSVWIRVSFYYFFFVNKYLVLL